MKYTFHGAQISYEEDTEVGVYLHDGRKMNFYVIDVRKSFEKLSQDKHDAIASFARLRAQASEQLDPRWKRRKRVAGIEDKTKGIRAAKDLADRVLAALEE